jgi:hypothetical protein
MPIFSYSHHVPAIIIISILVLFAYIILAYILFRQQTPSLQDDIPLSS